MTENTSSDRPERDGTRLMRFDMRKSNRVGDMLRQAFGDPKKDDSVESEFDRLLSKI